MRTALHRSCFLPLMGALCGTAWLTLWIWSNSPYARYLDHGDWTRMDIAQSICASLPAGEIVVPMAFYVGGWLLMLVAMMLPTTLPLLEIYRRLTRTRPDRHMLLALVVAGYLGAWTAFGVAAHGLDWSLHRLVEQNTWLIFRGWIFQAAVLLVAGAFQFSSLKYRCLDKCRMPLGFVLDYWQGRAERRQALRLGFAHGLFCVGCCWALMMLMFIVGTGNIGWMMVLGAIMAMEKNVPSGRRMARSLGGGLLALAAISVVDGLGVV